MHIRPRATCLVCQPCSGLTCAQEEHLVAPIHRIHLIHHQRSEAVVHTGPHHKGATMDRINGAVHEGVGSDEIYSLIREVLGGPDAWSEGSSWALTARREEVFMSELLSLSST